MAQESPPSYDHLHIDLRSPDVIFIQSSAAMQHSFDCCVQVGDVQATCHELEKKLQAAEVKASKVCERLHHADLCRLGPCLWLA
jgi:hypothetical protein